MDIVKDCFIDNSLCYLRIVVKIVLVIVSCYLLIIKLTQIKINNHKIHNLSCHKDVFLKIYRITIIEFCFVLFKMACLVPRLFNVLMGLAWLVGFW